MAKMQVRRGTIGTQTTTDERVNLQSLLLNRHLWFHVLPKHFVSNSHLILHISISFVAFKSQLLCPFSQLRSTKSRMATTNFSLRKIIIACKNCISTTGKNIESMLYIKFKDAFSKNLVVLVFLSLFSFCTVVLLICWVT